MLTKSHIHASLRAMGILPTDTLTLHCSLRAIGPVENGADGLIDALKDYLPQGLLLIPTHTWDNVDREHPCYDVRSTVPCIGTLARVAAFRPDGFRSLHPTHSLTGFGSRAREYLTGEERSQTPAPITGALNRLYEENAKILLIGVDHNRNTYLHAVDERLNIPNRLNSKPYTMTITDHRGSTFSSPAYYGHHCEGMEENCSAYYPNYTPFFDHLGVVSYGRLGNARVICCHVREMTDALARLWEKAEFDLCDKVQTIPERYYREI